MADQQGHSGRHPTGQHDPQGSFDIGGLHLPKETYQHLLNVLANSSGPAPDSHVYQTRSQQYAGQPDSGHAAGFTLPAQMNSPPNHVQYHIASHPPLVGSGQPK